MKTDIIIISILGIINVITLIEMLRWRKKAKYLQAQIEEMND